MRITEAQKASKMRSSVAQSVHRSDSEDDKGWVVGMRDYRATTWRPNL